MNNVSHRVFSLLLLVPALGVFAACDEIDDTPPGSADPEHGDDEDLVEVLEDCATDFLPGDVEGYLGCTGLGVCSEEPAEGQVCGDLFPPGPSLLDTANCVAWTGTTIASCSGTNRLFRPCDADFVEWCNGQGADVVACEDHEVLSIQQYECLSFSPLAPACDTSFVDACDTIDGAFYEKDPTALSGGCQAPPIPLDTSADTTCPGGATIICSCESAATTGPCTCEEVPGESVSCSAPGQNCDKRCPKPPGD